MDIEELNVYDYALFIDEYVQITSIENCGYCNSRVYIKHQDGDIWPTHLSNLKPIPLTIEVLEKNGFTDNYKEDDLCYAQSCGDIIGIHISGKNGIMEEMYFKYVHELQHALKLCGIEKEITL